MIFSDEQVLNAVNNVATRNAEGDERHILATAIDSLCETSIAGDSFDDWAFGAGAWDVCQTAEQAWAQIEEFAQQWDDLMTETEAE